MFRVMNVPRPRSQPSLNGGFGQVLGEQWLFSEGSQQTLPVKLAHHLELGQDQGQGAIDSARMAPRSRGDGLKVARSREKEGLLGKALNNPSERFRLEALSSGSRLPRRWPLLLTPLQNPLQP